MKTLNLKVRFKNPIFIVQLILAIFTPILAYAGLTAQDVTSWAILGNLIVSALSNPYVLSLVVVSVWNSLVDPTTPGFFDGLLGASYDEPGINYEYFDEEVSDDTEDVEDDFEEEEQE